MIREVPAGDWGVVLERFTGEHRGWLATIQVVEPDGALTRRGRVRVKSVTHTGGEASIEFLDDEPPVSARRPAVVRIQQRDNGAEQALEIETVQGQFVRLAFRATALPEQLDGLAPDEVEIDRRLVMTARGSSLEKG